MLSELGGRVSGPELILRTKGEVDDANDALDQDFTDGDQGEEDQEDPPLFLGGHGAPILARGG